MDVGLMLLVLAVLVGGILYSVHKSQKVTEAWSVAARVLQLAHVPGGWMQDRRLSGKIDGRMVVVETITRGSGKRSSKYTRYRVNYSQPLRLGLDLRKQGFFAGMAKAFGAQDIQVGDPDFDARFLIKGADSRSVALYLTKARRNLIWQAAREFDDLAVDDGGVQCEFAGEEDASHVLIRKIRRLAEFARSMEGGHAEAKASEVPEVTYAMPVHHARPVHTPPPLPGPTVLPTPVKREIPPELRPTPVPARTVERVVKTRVPEPGKSRIAEKQQPSTPAASPPAGTSPARCFSAHEVGVALFGKSSGIKEAERTFAANFADQEIEGQGVVRHAKTTNFDFVLGSGSFVKATVDVPLPAGDAYGRSMFQVVLRLPAATSCPPIGQSMAFRGRLVKMDGLMRQLHVRSE